MVHVQEVSQVLAGAPAPMPSSSTGLGQRQGGAPASLVLGMEGGGLVLAAAGVDQVSLAVYELDVELLFSQDPFNAFSAASQATARLGGGRAAGSSFSFIRPAHSLDRLALTSLPHAPGGRPGRCLHLPTLLAGLPPNTSLMVQVAGGGLVALLPLFCCSLLVHTFTALGLLQVVEKQSGQAVVAAYVKVFSQGAGEGRASAPPAFHKDGYTDLLGRFDFWSLSDGRPRKVAALAVLVAHPAHGETVMQVQPPPH
ncbi:hypothetical protein V8C86DRAFT_996719 [Haematococcus lacustris]